MSRTTNLLRPMAFRPIAQDVIPAQSFHQLQFPQTWFEGLLAVYQASEKHKFRDTNKVNLPTAALNNALRAVVPDLIYVSSLSRNYIRNGWAWLYSSRPVDPEVLLIIVRAWAEICLTDVSPTDLQAILRTFQAADLKWQSGKLNGGWKHLANGTADPEGAFAVLPYYLAAELSRQPIAFDQELLTLKRYPLSAGVNGAELMAWPPLWHPGHRKAGHFAPYINLTLQTVPFHPEPLIYVHAGTRRFVDPDTNFGQHKIKSAIVHTPLDWVEGHDYEHSLQVVGVRNRRLAENTYQLHWDDSFVKVLSQLMPGLSLPPAYELLGKGDTYRHGPIEGLLLHNTQVDGHAVSPGMSPVNRAMVMAHVTEHLAPGWEPVPNYERVSVSVTFSAKTPFKPAKEPKPKKTVEKQSTAKLSRKREGIKPHDPTTATDRSERIETAVGKAAQLRCCYQNPVLKEVVMAELANLLGTSFDDKAQCFKTESGFQLRVTFEKPGELAAPLDYVPNGQTSKKKQAVYALAKTKRCQQVVDRFTALPTDSLPAGVLFELENRDYFLKNGGELADPKQAIRQGFARQGYLTQFMDASNRNEKDLPHRVRKAVLDLLRQWGVLPHSPHVKRYSHQPKRYLGIWVIRQNSLFDGPQLERPVAVLLTGNSIQVKSLNFDWMPYAQAQLRLAEPAPPAPLAERQSRLLLWLDSLTSNLPDDTLLLMDAQNIRGVWSDIQNKTILPDRLVFNRRERPIETCNGLRVVRLRRDLNNETPLVYGVKNGADGTEATFANGVFAISERVFASVGEKPDTAQVTAKSSKFGPFVTQYQKRKIYHDAEPDTQVWNPRVCELTVMAIQPGDEPAFYASITHELRKLSLQFDDMTTLPLPLHLADKLGEYVRE